MYNCIFLKKPTIVWLYCSCMMLHENRELCNCSKKKLKIRNCKKFEVKAFEVFFVLSILSCIGPRDFSNSIFYSSSRLRNLWLESRVLDPTKLSSPLISKHFRWVRPGRSKLVLKQCSSEFLFLKIFKIKYQNTVKPRFLWYILKKEFSIVFTLHYIFTLTKY